MRAFRSLVYLVWLYGAMTLIGIGGMPITMLRRDFGFAVSRTWTRALLFGLRWIVGARVVIRGAEHMPKGPALVAAKHQSMLDTLLPFLWFERPAMVLKEELTRAPVFGWYTIVNRHIALDRGAHAAALKNLLRAARDRVADGRPVVIFPEGTRQVPGAPPDYKPGVAALYRDLGLPCTPVALDSGRVWPAKGWMMSPGVVTVEFLPPIPPGLSRDAFMAQLEERVETATAALFAHG